MHLKSSRCRKNTVNSYLQEHIRWSCYSEPRLRSMLVFDIRGLRNLLRCSKFFGIVRLLATGMNSKRGMLRIPSSWRVQVMFGLGSAA
jgi:hypothetical protein